MSLGPVVAWSPRRTASALLLLLATAGPCWAEASKADAAEAAAAMERAQRLANSPMRVILQAGKIRRKTPEAGEAAAGVAEAKTTGTTVTATSAATASTGVLAANAAPAVAREPVESKLLTTHSPLTRPPVPTAVAGLESAGMGTVAVDAPTPKLVPMAALAALPAPPTVAAPPAPAAQPGIVTMVEPPITQRMLEEVGGMSDLSADLTVRPDGSVTDVTLLSSVPRQFVRLIKTALLQWRFESTTAPRVQRVQLVFNNR